MNEIRNGNFTSSQIFRLCGTPSVAKTYIAKKNIERRLNDSIEGEAYSQAMAWGNFLEQRVHDLLGFDYILCSDETDQHPTIKTWVGSKDFVVPWKRISELKCYQLENFVLYTDALISRDIELLKKEFTKEYWQGVSNAIINQVPNAELISYCPFESELPEIVEMARDYIGSDMWKYRFIYENTSLPCIKNDGYYNNLNRFEFEVPKEDIEFLTNKVIEYSKQLTPFYEPTKPRETKGIRA